MKKKSYAFNPEFALLQHMVIEKGKEKRPAPKKVEVFYTLLLQPENNAHHLVNRLVETIEKR
jgi:hypothetical protein